MEEVIKNRIDSLILDYLSEEIDAESRAELLAWIESSPNNRAYFNNSCELYLASGIEGVAAKYDSDKAFERFFVDKFSSRTRRESRRKVILARFVETLSVAAIISIVAVFAFRGGQRNIKNVFSDISVEAPMGSVSRLELPDGSKVWLNAGSMIIYSQGFGVSDRRVTISGEGYFEVAHNEELPFYVSTNSLQIKVLGTKFNFRDYPSDVEAMVSLVEGRVSMTNLLKGESEKFLNPDQRVVLNKQSGDMRIELKTASNAIQWTNGVLFFDEELLPDIAKELERNYNVRISVCGEHLQQMRVFGCFILQRTSLEDILTILSATNKISYRMEGNEITLFENNI